MSRVCAVCGKSSMKGHKVSHSNIKTNKQFGVNIQTKTIEVNGKPSKEYVCTKCIKTSKKSDKPAK